MDSATTVVERPVVRDQRTAHIGDLAAAGAVVARRIDGDAVAVGDRVRWTAVERDVFLVAVDDVADDERLGDGGIVEFAVDQQGNPAAAKRDQYALW